MSAVWHEGEWIIHLQSHENDKTRLTMYVVESFKEQFSNKFAEEWATWGGQRGAVRRGDGYRPQDFFQVQIEAITSAVTAELNEKYNALQEQKRQASHSSRHTQPRSEADDDMNGGVRPAVRPPRPKGEGRGANTRQ